ncbi:MAG: histidinol-phosphate transaminase [Saprospiraceae bacterium]
MANTISRRLWLQSSAMAAAILPLSRFYDPESHDRKYYSREKLFNKNAIRLNLNENAYGPSEAARKAIMDSLVEANRYPRQFITELKNEIAKKEGLTPDHVMVTAGSTELLGLAGLYYGLKGGELLACHPTFDFLMVYAERMGCNWARTPLDENHQYDLNALSNLTGANTKLIFICNPNNPTGVEIPYNQLKSFCEEYASKYPVYMDEAYLELSPNGRSSSMSGLISSFPKLIVGRTFSKVYGLAGMRIGYALAQPDVIKGLSDMHTGRSLTLSAPAGAAALACLGDPEFENFSRTKIIEGRDMVAKAFDQWGVKYLPSAANFIFFKNEKFGTDPVAALAKEDIFLRTYDYTPGWTRVSIGTVEEMKQFVDAAGKYIV